MPPRLSLARTCLWTAATPHSKWRASARLGLTLRIWTPPKSKPTDRWFWRWEIACSRISGIVSGLCAARADMESAHALPIDTSGRRTATGRVIGIVACGCDPVCHDGRSVSSQAVAGNDRGRLVHGGACVAPATHRHATRWTSRVHGTVFKQRPRRPCVRSFSPSEPVFHKASCHASRRSRCAPAC